jgi:hypothetical protein
VSADEFQRRHAVRYGKVMRRKMTLLEALAANDRDWQKMRAALARDLAKAKREGRPS